MGHLNCLVGLEITWVQGRKSSPQFSLRLVTITLDFIKQSPYIKCSIKKIVTHINFLDKQLTWPMLILNYRFGMG